MKILECRRVRFFSRGDEDAFFGLLRANTAIRRMEGIGDTLYLHVTSRMSEGSLRDLLATFHRYRVPMKQLAQFASEQNRGWFEKPDSYWFSKVFGAGRPRSSKLAKKRTAGRVTRRSRSTRTSHRMSRRV